MEFLYFVVALCYGVASGTECKEVFFSVTGQNFPSREACQPHANIWFRKNMNPGIAVKVRNARSVISSCVKYEELVKISSDAKGLAKKPGSAI